MLKLYVLPAMLPPLVGVFTKRNEILAEVFT